MNVSSTSLFRFTTKFAHLKEIVEKGFGFRPCVEDMAVGAYENDPFISLGIVREQLHSLAICFCDLPLGQSKNHRDQYGNYVIAMSKEWAMRRKVTPIRYYHADSPDYTDSMTRIMFDVMLHAQRHKDGVMGVLNQSSLEPGEGPSDCELEQLPDSVKRLLGVTNGFAMQWLQHYWKTFQFSRIYQGEWTDRTTGARNQRRFYDEREWRAVTINPDDRLAFEFSDVRYVIVTSEEERKEIGNLFISLAEPLKIADTTEVWSKIKLADESFGDA